MGAGHAARKHRAADRCQPFPDLHARAIPCSSAPRESLASLEDKRLDLLAAHAEYRSDLGVRVVTQLKENQRGTLVGWQPLHVLEHFAEVLPPLNLIRRAIETR